MLELATRARCEQNHDFARVLTQLAFEVFEHARATPRIWDRPRRRAAVYIENLIRIDGEGIV
jgi:hypothetical protein